MVGWEPKQDHDVEIEIPSLQGVHEVYRLRPTQDVVNKLKVVYAWCEGGLNSYAWLLSFRQRNM